MSRFWLITASLAVLSAGCAPRSTPDPRSLAVAGPPALLSEFYFFDEPEPGGSLQTRVGVERYDLVNALFTDHATKDRHLYLPPGTAVRYDATGVFVFPVGSALIKTFAQHGVGAFAAPLAIEAEIVRQFDVARIGTAQGLKARFYAISTERRIKHPAVAMVTERARRELFVAAD